MVCRKIATAINAIYLVCKRGDPFSPLIKTLTNKVDEAYLDFMSVNSE